MTRNYYYNEEFGQEHDVQEKEETTSGANVLKTIALMLSDDLIGTHILFQRVIFPDRTYEAIALELEAQGFKPVTRQAIYDRCRKLKDKYDSSIGAMLMPVSLDQRKQKKINKKERRAWAKTIARLRPDLIR